MQRREFLHALAAFGVPGALSACGGGSAPGASDTPRIHDVISDKPRYYVGEHAMITATFSGGSARIEPGGIPVTSGVPATVGPLSTTSTYRLIVASSNKEVFQDIALPTGYRNVFTAVPMEFSRAMHVAVEAANGRVLIVGGEGSDGVPASRVMAFNMQAESFSSVGDLFTGRSGHTATMLPDGTVLVVGGNRLVSNTPIAERFDPVSGISRPTLTQPPDNRIRHTATLLPDGRVLFAGGRTPGGGASSDTLDVFDFQTERFTRLPSRLAFARYGHAALRITQDSVLLYGGAAISGLPAAPEIVDIPDFSATAMTPRPFDLSTRMGAAVVKAIGGDYLIVGGEMLDGTPLSSIISVATGGIGIYPAGQMQIPRTMHAAAPLSDGKVLIIGGSDSATTAALSSSELYSVAGGVSVAGPDLLVARTNHSATLLSNGKVLVVGGIDAGMNTLSTAELFG